MSELIVATYVTKKTPEKRVTLGFPVGFIAPTTIELSEPLIGATIFYYEHSIRSSIEVDWQRVPCGDDTP